MIGVIVPVHNEEELLPACLQALSIAIGQHARSTGGKAVIVVVLDCCTDRSMEIARGFDVVILECASRSVGAARACGAESALAAGATWLAFTDGDTEVAPDWLGCQLALKADAVCGTIGVRWMAEMDSARKDFELNYQDVDDHRHIHGANFGISARAYRAAGGFSNRRCHEDVAIVKSLLDAGHRVAWSARPRVTTSARLEGRAPSGFAAALKEQLHSPTDDAHVKLLVPEILSGAERLARSFACIQLAGVEVAPA